MLIEFEELKKIIHRTKYSYHLYYDLKLSGISKDHEAFCWFEKGLLHRKGKPAVEFFNGRRKEWYEKGNLIKVEWV